MSTTHAEERAPEQAPGEPGPRRAKIVRRTVAIGAVVVVLALLVGGGVMFSWMADETQFARQSDEFDALVAEVEELPGVTGLEHNRWVEAPTFSHPRSWVHLTVDRAGLPALIDTACAADHPEAVAWSILVRTPSGGEASVHGNQDVFDDPTRAGDACPDFGFDVLGVIDELDRVAPGLSVQPAIWDYLPDGPRDPFALVSLDDSSEDYLPLLPLVTHAVDLAAAAGIDRSWPVEINAGPLGLTVEAGQGEAYVDLLTELAEQHDVTTFWGDLDHQSDGVPRVQLSAPEREHGAIEQLIRASGLPIADIEIRFLDLESP